MLLEATGLCPRREEDTLYAPVWLSDSTADVA